MGEVLDAFQGERIINALIHVQDLQVDGDANYATPILDFNLQEVPYFTKLPSFMEDLLHDEHLTPTQDDA